MEPLYTYAVKHEDGAYKIVHHIGIPVQKTIEEAKQDFKCFSCDTNQKE